MQNKHSWLSEPPRIMKMLFSKVLYGYFRNKITVTDVKFKGIQYIRILPLDERTQYCRLHIIKVSECK